MKQFVAFIFLCTFTLSSDEFDQNAFLEANALKEGVVVTASGLQYEILQPGNGESPSLSDNVVVWYEGKLWDGTEFDSNMEKSPSTFSPSQVIPGWKEGLQLMSKGSRFKFWIPANLGYGSKAAGLIPENSLLIFEVELVDIKENGWFQKIFLAPIVGPFKVMHAIMFVLYVGFKFWWKQPGKKGAQCKASHILVDHEDKAKAIQKRLGGKVSPEAFGKEAKEHSSCPSKDNGGSLGWFGTGDMVKEFGAVCFDKKNKLNTVLGPVKTKHGWHLIYVEERKFPETKKDQ